MTFVANSTCRVATSYRNKPNWSYTYRTLLVAWPTRLWQQVAWCRRYAKCCWSTIWRGGKLVKWNQEGLLTAVACPQMLLVPASASARVSCPTNIWRYLRAWTAISGPCMQEKSQAKRDRTKTNISLYLLVNNNGFTTVWTVSSHQYTPQHKDSYCR